MICAYGPEPRLAEVVAAMRPASGARPVIVVGNGSPPAPVWTPRWSLMEPGSEHRFRAGCNLGVQAASGSTVVFVNSDAFVEPDCLALLHGERV